MVESEPNGRPANYALSVNPYAPTAVASMEATGVAWPYDLPLSNSRRVRRLAKDADRAAMSILGAFFMGLLGPIVFTIFFIVQLWTYDRLVRQYPDLLSLEHQHEPVAKSFAAARSKFVAWACIFGTLLVVEFAWIASLFMA